MAYGGVRHCGREPFARLNFQRSLRAARHRPVQDEDDEDIGGRGRKRRADIGQGCVREDKRRVPELGQRSAHGGDATTVREYDEIETWGRSHHAVLCSHMRGKVWL